MVRVSLVMTG